MKDKKYDPTADIRRLHNGRTDTNIIPAQQAEDDDGEWFHGEVLEAPDEYKEKHTKRMTAAVMWFFLIWVFIFVSIGLGKLAGHFL